MLVGADTGGTFTDLVAADGRVVKVLSTPDDPGRALREGLAALAGGRRPALLAHGTTVATNALLERRGARVALVTTAGFADVIEIGRQNRPSLYDIGVERPDPLVPRRLRYEVDGRLDATGTEISPVPPAGQIPTPADDVAAVAVCLLHADLNPAHEEAVAEVLEARGLDVSRSSEISPEFREYERTVTTVVNAYLRPVCRPYLERLGDLADEVLVMTSAGGLAGSAEAARLPAALLLSGPAGGVRAGAAIAAACGYPDAVTFDMGGTSTDVCLVRGGVPEPAPGREVGGFPVRLPSLDIRTIGAGGGSIARLDPGGALVVGPQSAGADPGPACYGRGGTAPTVTDADLVLGRIPPGSTFPGLGALDLAAATAALLGAAGKGLGPCSGERTMAVESVAAGVVAVVDAAMEQAVRAVTVERGVDPAGLALVAFGGAGPLHACALAEALNMAAVIVPPRAGALSAVGLLCSPRQRELVRSWPRPAERGGLEAALAALGAQARAAVAATGADRGGVGGSAPSVGGTLPGGTHPGGSAEPPVEVEVALDCRYAGQSHELTVPAVEAFPAEHERRNGYARPDAPVEVVALRVRARRPAPLEPADLPAVVRERRAGPAVAVEADCTVWIPPGWVAEPGPLGAWILTRAGTEGRS